MGYFCAPGYLPHRKEPDLLGHMFVFGWVAYIRTQKPLFRNNGKLASGFEKFPGDKMAKTARFKVGTINLHSYGGQHSAASYKARGVALKAVGADVWLLCETNEAMRKQLLATLGKGWKTWALGSKTVAILFNSNVFSYSTIRKALFGTAFGHGVLVAPLVHKASKVKVEMGSVHVRPKSVATSKQKLVDVGKIPGRFSAKVPNVLGGDFSLNKPAPAGFKRVTPVVDTMPGTSGMQSVDAIFTRGKVVVEKVQSFKMRSLTDHDGFVVALAVTN